MARPTNEELKAKIRTRHAALKKLYPSGVDLLKLLSVEFTLTERSIRHHLKTGKGDSRFRYTDEERAALCTMTRKEILAWAKLHGREPHSVYTAAMRLRHKTEKYIPGDKLRASVVARGYLNFGSSAELQAYNSSLSAMQNVKRVLTIKHDLTLTGPNFITNNATRACCVLTLAEQVALLESPLRFVKTRSVALDWRPAVVEYCLDLVNPCTIGKWADLATASKHFDLMKLKFPETEFALRLIDAAPVDYTTIPLHTDAPKGKIHAWVFATDQHWSEPLNARTFDKAVLAYATSLLIDDKIHWSDHEKSVASLYNYLASQGSEWLAVYRDNERVWGSANAPEALSLMEAQFGESSTPLDSLEPDELFATTEKLPLSFTFSYGPGLKKQELISAVDEDAAATQFAGNHSIPGVTSMEALTTLFAAKHVELSVS